ncbi:38605_t:CDS:2 [Gigaspora margarita]|uniref:38605_t:CDS:1 n=1 Tax=Gigaspora margarita TaxID=4874 RepID=A0ABN7WN37_GIGMA|nr:38605_t:CDS:2 [Gigaspora margarita]
MSTSILKTHYRQGANVLTSKQIKEIRCLKNKQNGNHFYEELRKAQSISSENSSEVHAKQPCEASDESTPKESSESGSIQNSNLPKILARGPCQNSLLNVSYELITSIKKDHIELEESMRESEKLFALNSLR